MLFISSISTVKLLVMLTMPADKKMRNPNEYNQQLALYKESFVNADIISIMLGIAAPALARIGMERTHQDIQLIELVLSLIRNLLAIVPSRPAVSDEFVSVLEKENVFMLILHLLSQSDAPENARFPLLLLELVYLVLGKQDAFTLASSPDISLEPPTEKINMAEIETNRAKSYSPAPLAASMGSPSISLPVSSDSIARPQLRTHMSSKGAALAAALEANSKPKTGAAASNSPQRHSRFGGYVVSSSVIKSNVKLSSFVEKPKDTDEEENAKNKQSADRSKRPPRNTEWSDIPSQASSSLVSITDIIVPKLDAIRKSKIAASSLTSSSAIGTIVMGSSSGNFVTRSVLKRLARSIMQYGYNTLMEVTSSLVTSHSPTLTDSDLDHYVWSTGFFPAFVSADYKTRLAQATEACKNGNNSSSNGASIPESVEFDAGSFQTVFEDQTFYYLLEQLERYETEKNAAKVEVHFVALKNLIFTLLALHESGLSEEMRIAESIVMKLIYNPELLVDRLPRLVKTFTNLRKAQHILLPHLIEGVHLFLTVLERISEHGLKKLVQLKKRARVTMSGSKLIDEEEERSLRKSILEEDDMDDIGVVKDVVGGNESSKADAAEGDQSKRKSSSDAGSNDGASDSAKLEDLEDREKRLKEKLRLLQEEEEDDDDEDAANEKYFNVQDYINFYSKQSIINAIMELLRMYNTNLERTNEAALGMLKRIRSVGGLPMLFQVSHLRVFALILTDVHPSKLGPSAQELRTFARETTAAFLNRFAENPVMYGLTSLVPKKLTYAKELDEGLYLTYNSTWDGTLERVERSREGTGFQEPPEDYDEVVDNLHKTNPSRVGASYNQKARPYLGEGLEGNADFDLGALLAAPNQPVRSSRIPKQSKQELIDSKWKELLHPDYKARQWTEQEKIQLQNLYSSYSDLEESELVPMLLSMMNPEATMTPTDVYIQLSRTLDATEMSKLQKPSLEPDVMASIEASMKAKPAPTSSVKPLHPKPSARSHSKAGKEDEGSDGEVTFTAPEPRPFSENDTLSDSDDDSMSNSKVRITKGFNEGKGEDGEFENDNEDSGAKGKTMKQMRDEMRRRALELQSWEKKKREELAELAEKRREERAEQKVAREAAEAEAKEKRLQEKALAKEEKEKQKMAEVEAKKAAREAKEKEKLEAKAKKAEERMKKKGDSKAISRTKRSVRKPVTTSSDGEEGENNDSGNEMGDSGLGTSSEEASVSKSEKETKEKEPSSRRSRPKRAAASRTNKKMSDFDRYLEGLDSSEEPLASSSDSNSGKEDNDQSSAPKDVNEDNDAEVKISSDAEGHSEGSKPSKKKGKRKRGSGKDDNDEDYMIGGAGSDDEEVIEDSSAPSRFKKPKRGSSASTPAKKATSAKKSSKAAESKSPAKKKPKLSAAETQTDSAPLEASSVALNSTDSDLLNTSSSTKRRLIRPEKQSDDEDDLDMLL